ncbi:HD domain-containing protein [Ruminococcus sp.]|uniref:HD domain-containing protein n=1 Tax=Ruminococcus sp. TaxID=41978 RepID=UPI0025EB1916|nr:HD domain-containing protein [Ruminococcus sp.]MCI6616406.1 HD domain-containing protein [Ruminococcus sp.]
MKIPTIVEAEKLLNEAEQRNPGAWISHSKTAAFCAKAISERCDNLDVETAYVFGLLHDIGRREGVTDMRHIIDGYHFMTSLGFDDCARICLTHSFPYKDIRSYNGQNDCTGDETEFIKRFLDNTEYDDYDRMIQLCDALALPDGATYIEKRLVDVVMRRGFNDLTISKWKAFLELKVYFDKKTETDIYKLIGV